MEETILNIEGPSYTVNNIIYSVGDTVANYLPCKNGPDKLHVQATHRKCPHLHLWLAPQHCRTNLFSFL